MVISSSSIQVPSSMLTGPFIQGSFGVISSLEFQNHISTINISIINVIVTKVHIIMISIVISIMHTKG